MASMKLQIIDLDGCISDDRRRRHLIDPLLAHDNSTDAQLERQEMFRRYHSSCDGDPAANLDRIRRDCHHVILTARLIDFKARTLFWLEHVAHVVPRIIIMRNTHDHLPSLQLKEWMVTELLNPNSYNVNIKDIIHAIDDHQGIVDMYRTKFGINAEVVRIGAEEHKYA